MTRQEEIDKEIDKIIGEPLPAYHPQVGLVYAAIQGSTLETIRDKILAYLHSQGVVIKVGEDEVEVIDSFGASYKTKCVAVEPLIGEETDEDSRCQVDTTNQHTANPM